MLGLQVTARWECKFKLGLKLGRGVGVAWDLQHLKGARGLPCWDQLRLKLGHGGGVGWKLAALNSNMGGCCKTFVEHAFIKKDGF